MNKQSKKSKKLFNDGTKALFNNDYIEALDTLIQSLENKPSDIPIWINIGITQTRIKKYQQAIETFNFILQLDSNNFHALAGLAYVYYCSGNLNQAISLGETVYNVKKESWVHLIYAEILCAFQPDRQTRLDIYKLWGEKYANHLSIGQPTLNPNKDPSRKLRIGYVSGDMKHHSVAYFMEPVFSNHNHDQVDVYVFATNHNKDQTTERLKSLIPHWFDVATLDDKALLKLIRHNKIDILIDLSGHTSDHRLFVFAKRAAPIQLTWLGFMGTLGMNAIDYRLTDFGADPIGSEQWYVERLFRLECMASYCPPADSPLALEPPLSSQTPTLISLNASKKITDNMLLIWKRILEARPDANLILHVTDNSIDEAINTMLPKLEQLEMPLDQISISPQVPITEFMERGLVADIALDTHPISGGTTTLHALWMGLPVIAMEAEDAMSSSTARTLQGLGLSEWVANNEEEYIQIVLNLIEDKERLRKHRAEIRDILSQSALMNYKARCTELERSFRLMWFNYLLGESRYLQSNFDLAIETDYLRQKLGLNIGN